MKRLSVVVALLCCCAVHAQTDGIWFLHLRLTNDQVVLVKQQKTPGVLKSRRGPAPAQPLRIDLKAQNGTTLWSQTIDDPAVRRIEYEDPLEPGKMRARQVTLTNVEFTVRIPYQPKARNAVVSRRTSGAAPKAGVAKSAPAQEYIEIGRVALQPEENP
jgi:hypothetical protein